MRSVVLLFVLLSTACGSSALKVNVGIAQVMLEAQVEAGPLIRAQRQNAMREAARAAHDRGEPQDVAELAARTVAGRWECAVNTSRIYSTAVGSYIDALSLWAAGRDFALLDAVPYIRRALGAYRATTACLLSLGSTLLPATPVFFDLLPPAWGIE